MITLPDDRHVMRGEPCSRPSQIVLITYHEIDVMQRICIRMRDTEGMMIRIGETAHKANTAVDLVGRLEVEHLMVEIQRFAVMRRAENDVTEMLHFHDRGNVGLLPSPWDSSPSWRR